MAHSSPYFSLSRIFVRYLSCRHRALFYIKLLCRYAALKMACSSSLGGPPVPRPSQELLGFMSYTGEDPGSLGTLLRSALAFRWDMLFVAVPLEAACLLLRF
nr:hypothetical protein Iba_chr02aCG2260 [Ipomoea batatas]